ncbi:hypothetical protein COV81_01205 [Candidatus Peregrinibacteria bacterium CG11_big_fil_rev_8_21_14_0_20_41_10]|nr:MAG: hypothetical protein COV81_01205 [Candidatus Peregrinibacteria bacterium CG11_big_fil_rev_8_21_14_0_20_41_10]PIZ75750.1 MAG: hypothetical protein COY06_02740 [Candidatus Peregrinibacteria bacterium CG_4_10_14_0_2_um_filter_41_8]PJC37861.1 MAG: hypothetical protein CO045_03300 [Candidatus Peregrinibacteria bacterium CG_4_9_14_0_2_um_filter_41_14]
MIETVPHINTESKNKTTAIYQNINCVSFYFFATLGFVHLISGLFVANEIALKGMWLINRLLDVPFFIVSYLYFASLFKLQLDSDATNTNVWDLLIIVVGIGLLLFLQVYDLVFPNLQP